MFLEYDRAFCVYRPRLGDTFTSVNGWRSFPDMKTAVYELSLVGLKVGKQTTSRTWRIELKD